MAGNGNNIWQALQQSMLGTVVVLAAASTVTITDSNIAADSIILTSINTADATVGYVKSVVCAVGSAVVTMSGTATADVTLGYVILNQES